ncbi:MAG TPA: hypothetical protein VN193_12415 [Candidatus Angelobacter sp.]|nr:hypothetical protein [Candidatus Angelobacter sp.]
MSLDVLLQPRNAALDPARVLEQSAARRHYRPPVIDGNAWRVTYDNADTGAHWLLAWEGDALSASLDYVRPTFFAVEAIEELTALAHALDLAPTLGGTPLDTASLLRAWTDGNAVAIEALRRHGQLPPYMPPDRAHAWWVYTLARPNLARQLHDSAFVPSATLVSGGDSTTVERLVTWPDAIACVLPPCEHLVLLRSHDGSGAPPFDARLAAHDDVVVALDDLLVRAASVAGLRLLPATQSAAAAERLASLRTEPMHRFDTVRPDGFVDVR